VSYTRQEPLADLGTNEDFELPSVNESKGADFEEDELEDGGYQFVITEISQRLPNNYPKQDGSPGNPRRAFWLQVVNGESAEDVGKRVKVFFTESNHPKSYMYPFLKAAMGGDLDPNERPKLYGLVGKQLRGTVVHKPGDDGQVRQRVESWIPAKKYFDVVPF
jgi:hypothetical protein